MIQFFTDLRNFARWVARHAAQPQRQALAIYLTVDQSTRSYIKAGLAFHKAMNENALATGPNNDAADAFDAFGTAIATHFKQLE
jgi:uncharacterized protein YcgI (DUF1989 family)